MKQKTAFDILKTGKNIFLTGSAGTGKTFILKKYIKYLKERGIQPAVIAPTGIAASHLNGVTVHSFFALGIRDNIDDYFLDNLLQKKYLHNRFSKLKVILIDEISMVSLKIFNSIDKILRAFKFSDKPFGGVQIIVSGDFFQLPPVCKNNEIKKFSWQSSS
ncbi:MAG: AAA family ATPase [Candidatus Pacebacteria bacterium]|nr:AAA family ATPase [Candidatus Paceibacterota bacterium]